MTLRPLRLRWKPTVRYQGGGAFGSIPARSRSLAGMYMEHPRCRCARVARRRAAWSWLGIQNPRSLDRSTGSGMDATV